MNNKFEENRDPQSSHQLELMASDADMLFNIPLNVEVARRLYDQEVEFALENLPDITTVQIAAKARHLL